AAGKAGQQLMLARPQSHPRLLPAMGRSLVVALTTATAVLTQPRRMPPIASFRGHFGKKVAN
ncbi:MAG: hypothetical protein ACUVRE_09550, partial [Thermoanaerobaculaceae bacterium]